MGSSVSFLLERRRDWVRTCHFRLGRGAEESEALGGLVEKAFGAGAVAGEGPRFAQQG